MGGADVPRAVSWSSMKTFMGPAHYLAAAAVFLAGCSQSPSAADATKFLDEAEKKIDELQLEAGRASWV